MRSWFSRGVDFRDGGCVEVVGRDKKIFKMGKLYDRCRFGVYFFCCWLYEFDAGIVVWVWGMFATKLDLIHVYLQRHPSRG